MQNFKTTWPLLNEYFSTLISSPKIFLEKWGTNNSRKKIGRTVEKSNSEMQLWDTEKN